jgi:hypothetical protein
MGDFTNLSINLTLDLFNLPIIRAWRPGRAWRTCSRPAASRLWRRSATRPQPAPPTALKSLCGLLARSARHQRPGRRRPADRRRPHRTPGTKAAPAARARHHPRAPSAADRRAARRQGRTANRAATTRPGPVTRTCSPGRATTRDRHAPHAGGGPA